jgi:glycosyltransferase involved in cell wall biosynthesis
MRFHVLSVPHTASNKQYLACAFTQKVVNMCKMLTTLGHHVIHYGNELSDVQCTEQVSVTFPDDIGPPEQSGNFDCNSRTYIKYMRRTIASIKKRKEPNDFLLCLWNGVREVAEAHSNMIVVEAGIGYPGNFFAPFKVFESYAMLHAYRGIDGVATANGNGWWYDAVIPNYYDLVDFDPSHSHDDYLLFMGLRSNGGEGKGLEIAIQVSREAGKKLVVAGPGQFWHNGKTTPPDHVELVGFVGLEQRRKLYSKALATLTPSLFIEPFCGVAVESMLSGTPVISCDHGAFAENVLHGITGYRCHTMEQFVWAVQHVHTLDRGACYSWAANNFSLERIGDMYEEYFKALLAIRTGKGWYEENSKRKDLNWLCKVYPQE